MACVRACPEGARTLHAMDDAARWLHENCSARREPELFV
jgi:ferredoxin